MKLQQQRPLQSDDIVFEGHNRRRPISLSTYVFSFCIWSHSELPIKSFWIKSKWFSSFYFHNFFCSDLRSDNRTFGFWFCPKRIKLKWSIDFRTDCRESNRPIRAPAWSSTSSTSITTLTTSWPHWRHFAAWPHLGKICFLIQSLKRNRLLKPLKTNHNGLDI